MEAKELTQKTGLFDRLLRGFAQDLLVLLMAVTVVIAGLPVWTYFQFDSDLVSEKRLLNSNNTGIVLYDQNGKVFFTFHQPKFYQEIEIDNIPKLTQLAFIAAEDKEFYSHRGFSPRGIARSVVANVKDGSLSYGGSTITQQLVKNSLLKPEKNLLRKYQEVVLAAEIERRFSKEQILKMYLNSVYFGEGAFGIEAAAKRYFDKSAKELDLAESAYLAAILPAPSRLSPFSDGLEGLKRRQRYVLNNMHELGYVGQEEKEKALSEKVAFDGVPNEVNTEAVHFALMVQNYLISQYGEEKVLRSGFRVKTTLNPQWQKKAQTALKEQVQSLKSRGASNGAAVIIDPQTGAVRVLVGSADWFDGEFGKINMAISPRSPGSAFKPIVYLTAFEKKTITPATILVDQPVAFNNYASSVFTGFGSDQELFSNAPIVYKPLNYDRKFRGKVSARRALANSLNVPSVHVMGKVGVNEALNTARKLGIQSLKDPSSYGLSFVLGTGEVSLLEMTAAYAVLANQGHRNEPYFISSITDKYGNEIFTHNSNPQLVADPKAVFLVNSILSDRSTRREAFGNALDTSITTAVKTGTSEDYRDSWTLGFTPKLAVGVWIGNSNNRPMSVVAGSLGAAPVWKRLIENLSQEVGALDFKPPEGVMQLPICPGTELVARDSQGAQMEYFIAGTEPKGRCIVVKTEEKKDPQPPQPSNQPQNKEKKPEKEDKKDEKD